MIINKKYGFLFVHIQKNAGSSIKKELSNFEDTSEYKYWHSFIDPEIENLQNYFKFCFVRNPWDRLVSWYNMMLSKGIHNDFSGYLLSNSKNFSEFLDLTNIIYETNKFECNDLYLYPKSISFNQLDYVSDNDGKILVDFIGKFENLQEDYNQICDKIKIKSFRLEKINQYNHKDYKSYYNDRDIEKVYNLYKRDIEYFDYKFE